MQQLNTQSDLVKFFDNNTKPMKANIVTRTPVKMNKKDVATKQIANPHGAVYKVQTIAVELNANYEIKVNTERMLEGKEQDFEVEQRKWGVRVNGSIVEKNGQFYLNTIEEEKIGTPTYETATGEKVEYDALKPFIPAYNPVAKQGLESDVKVRAFKLEHVIGVFVPGVLRYNPN